jgi:hypothetical protein
MRLGASGRRSPPARHVTWHQYRTHASVSRRWTQDSARRWRALRLSHAVTGDKVPLPAPRTIVDPQLHEFMAAQVSVTPQKPAKNTTVHVAASWRQPDSVKSRCSARVPLFPDRTRVGEEGRAGRAEILRNRPSSRTRRRLSMTMAATPDPSPAPGTHRATISLRPARHPGQRKLEFAHRSAAMHPPRCVRPDSTLNGCEGATPRSRPPGTSTPCTVVRSGLQLEA